ncbi:conserved hypothetical protein [Theileria equi strain WA]|uniref:Uncharacterized protein n=1 Tax=Theileria equi strain WA TaxID=1537102 RepID=L1LGW4_THEEQ|nr:conserved hypothetical protein [Theileria equi strain WA]EKX74363.1 conserved hypothetical protein [Theileria equi strain WA]|eukprot:XP_004833815.1 conserved hypothetical protein [Theileria equi strain WA]
MDSSNSLHEGSDPLVGLVDFDNFQDYTNDEDIVNKYFYKLYVSQITTDQMIDVMRHLGNSPNGSRNKSVYNTMLKILFNECRFFPKYPVQELAITAELFGKMIKHGLLLSNGPLLLLASRCILEALKRGKTSKMFQFGTIALSQFENSIASYPWFSNALLGIPDVRETFPQLYRTCEKLQTIITDGMRKNTYVDQARGIIIASTDDNTDLSQILENQSSHVAEPAPVPSARAPSIDDSTRQTVGEWENLMSDVGSTLTIVAPPEIAINQIYSIFNNICMDTVIQKSNEVNNILRPENFSWLILYIVRTRASKEHNLHEVFATFIDNLKYPKLFDTAIQVTYLCISACLRGLSDYKEILAYRTLLKNLGSWLGRITLARNVPIILRQLDIKALLFNAYENGALIAVLPFVCRAMESVKNSKIFKPPNPWTTAILTFLAEIHMVENLKTNLVFEVEVLFKQLSLDITHFSNKTNLLSNRVRPKVTPDFDTDSLVNPDEGIRTGSNDISKERLNQLLAKVMREGVVGTTKQQPDVPTSAGIPMQPGIMAPGGQPTHTLSDNHSDLYAESLLQTLHTSVVISPSIALFEIQPQLRGLVPIAIERAVRHVLTLVTDHSISLARMSTKVLIAKDFASEEDENVVRSATRLMFEHFASSLVSASCKEPLRMAFHESLRSALQTHRTQDCNDQVLVEQLVQIISQDNLALSVNVIEKVVAGHASRESEMVAADICKMLRTQPPQGIILPPLLQHWNYKNSQRDHHNLGVYRNIFTKPAKVASTTRQNSACDGVMVLFEECLTELREPLRDIALFPPMLYASGPLEPGCESHLFSTHSLHVLYSLPANHELFSYMAHCLSIVENSPYKESACIAIARCLLMFLSEGLGSHAGLNIEVLLCILDGLNHLSSGVKQALATLLFSIPLDQNNNLFNVVVVTGLLRYGLLDWTDLTQYLVLAMEKGKNTYAVEMAIVVTAIALIDQRSAPPECGAGLIREIASVSCGSEACKTYPGVLIKDAWAKLLKDYVELQQQPRPTVISLTPILRMNLSDVFSVDGFKVPGFVGLGYGGVRRVPASCSISDSHKSVISALFIRWVECSNPFDGEALLFAWRQFFQRFNLQNLFKMDGGTDSFFSACVHTAISMECMNYMDMEYNVDSLLQETSPEKATQEEPVSEAVNGSAVITDESSTKTQGEVDEKPDVVTTEKEQPVVEGDVITSTVELPTGEKSGFIALAKMADVMLRLVGGGDIPPSSALQKLLAALSSIIVHENSHYACYKLWMVLLEYFDKVEENFQVLCKITFLHALELINPTRAPSFTYFWFRIISHASLIPGAIKHQKCWLSFSRIFSIASTFVNTMSSRYTFESFESFVERDYLESEFASQDRMAEAEEGGQELEIREGPVYKILKIYTRLVSYACAASPDFVASYHLSFSGSRAIEKMAASCQRGKSAATGSNSIFKQQKVAVDLLPEMKISPKVPCSLVAPVVRNGLKLLVERALRSIAKFGPSLLSQPSSDFGQILQLIETLVVENTNEAVLSLNALVLYLGVYSQAALGPNENSGSTEVFEGSARLMLFLWLLKTLSPRAKYMFVFSIVRQLRQPNAHTHFFSCLLIWMFDECKSNSDEAIRSIILRVLLEWFIAPGPCPWGVSLVVVELFRNPRFAPIFGNFNTTPRINDLFESLFSVFADVFAS